jgi:o-succinylbenzoate---CoA ligase
VRFIFPSASIEHHALIHYAPQSAFEKQVVDFALRWLSQEQTFTFQTSGSTGAPKPINFSRKQIEGSVALTRNAFQLQAGQTALLCLDMNFVAAKLMIARALIVDMDLLVYEPSGNPFASIQQPIDFAALVPYQITQALNQSPQKIDLVKTIILGGAAVNPTLTKALSNRVTAFYETYGMTETLTHIAIKRIAETIIDFTTLPGISIRLDERQCLHITAPHIQADPISTNDIAELTSPNSFRLVGRFDTIINSGGIKLAPEAIEQKITAVLLQHFPASAFIITSLPDAQLGQQVVLLIETQSIEKSIESTVFQILREILTRYEVPKQILALPQFVRTASGKINRIQTQARLTNFG